LVYSMLGTFTLVHYFVSYASAVALAIMAQPV
jgi:hypothetical protein